jgi:4-amino-4-deoxy-L-arabinose transferase-like glycosyltransferase
MDLTLAACALAALVAASRVLDCGTAPVAGWSIAGLAIGAGLLVKGPVGAIVPLVVIAAYAATSRRARELVRPAAAWGLALACAVAAPWYVALAARGGTPLLGELVVRQNVVRFLAPWDHAASWWYYLVYLWIDLLPWSLFLPLAVGLVPDDERERRLHRLAWVWLAAIVLFFSLAASKRSPYILPVAPAVAVLVAAVGQRWIEGRLDPLRRRAGIAVAALLAAGWIGASALVVREAREFAPRLPELAGALGVSAAILAAGGAATLVALVFSRQRPRAAPAVALAAVVLCYIHAAVAVLPALDPLKSHRPMAEAIRRLVPPHSPLAGFHVWRWDADFSYYAGRPIPVIPDVERLTAYWSRPEPVFLVVERGRIELARSVIGARAPLAAHEAGHNAAFLFSNRPVDQLE